MLHRSTGHRISPLSLSLSLFADSPPCSHFCNLPQLIESQWCENMALWQRACQSARSLILFFSLFIILEIYMKIDWIKTERKSLPVALWRSLICITLLMLLGNLPVSVVACWIEVEEAKSSNSRISFFTNPNVDHINHSSTFLLGDLLSFLSKWLSHNLSSAFKLSPGYIEALWL